MSADEDWLKALAGHGGDTPEAREAAALRSAMRLRRVERPDVPDTSPAREAALLARARDNGLLAEPQRRATARRWGQWLPLSLASAALVAVLGIGVLITQPAPPGDTVRGHGATVVERAAADPPASARALAEALLDAGAEVRRYSELGDPLVEARLPTPVPEELRAVLADFALPLPADGELLVRFVEPPS